MHLLEIIKNIHDSTFIKKLLDSCLKHFILITRQIKLLHRIYIFTRIKFQNSMLRKGVTNDLNLIQNM